VTNSRAQHVAYQFKLRPISELGEKLEKLKLVLLVQHSRECLLRKYCVSRPLLFVLDLVQELVAQHQAKTGCLWFIVLKEQALRRRYQEVHSLVQHLFVVYHRIVIHNWSELLVVLDIPVLPGRFEDRKHPGDIILHLYVLQAFHIPFVGLYCLLRNVVPKSPAFVIVNLVRHSLVRRYVIGRIHPRHLVVHRKEDVAKVSEYVQRVLYVCILKLSGTFKLIIFKRVIARYAVD